MNLVGLMPVRNEDWILGLSARVALQWCDVLIVLDHASTDHSREIAAEIGKETGRLLLVADTNPVWDEMRHRQALLELARTQEIEATHIALIDADEILSANLIARVRDMVDGTPPGSILQLPLYNLRGGIGTYHANGLWGNRIVSVAFTDLPELHWAGDKYHSREPDGKRLTGYRAVGQGEGGVLHFWGANERRLRAKHALYKITERLRWPEKDVRQIEFTYNQWRDGARTGYDNAGAWAFSQTHPEWRHPHLEKYLDVDAVPWQEAEVRRLVAGHGREKFAGLELFGVDAPIIAVTAE